MSTATASPMLDLRPYQAEGLAAITEAWEEGIHRPAAVLATGLGKTVMFAHLAASWAQVNGSVSDGRNRVVVLVHRDELVRQAVGKLHSVAPHLAIGVVKADENDVTADVVVASIQTLVSEKRLRQLRDVGLVIVDECHHATAQSYLTVMRGLGCYDGRALSVGFTATMSRADGAKLGDVWGKVVYERDIVWGIQNGHLCDVKGIGLTVNDLDMSQVRTTAGDYSSADLGHALEESNAPATVASAYIEHAKDRPGIMFAPTVDTAELLAETLSGAGIHTETVTGTMDPVHRRAILARYQRGDIQVLSNCMVLTEGTDLPRAEVCVVARPTQSAALYVQMVGRVLRPFPGKEHALVLDVAGTAARHSLVGMTTLAGTEVLPGETLIDAIERELLAKEAALLDELDEAITGRGDGLGIISLHAGETRELDLFHGSRQSWLRTDAGWWFIPAGDWLVAIIPDERPGTWQVGYYGTRGGGGKIAGDLDDMSYAMAHGEKWITGSAVERLSSRAAGWRKRKPTKAQLKMAESVGAVATVEMFDDPLTAGELGDRISQRIATSRIDPRVASWLAVRGRSQ